MPHHPNLDPEMAAALAADPPPPTVLDGLPYEELAALRAERAARPVA
ncbi:alpha/beta hydrolase, partial [Streptomyces sp. SID4931]